MLLLHLGFTTLYFTLLRSCRAGQLSYTFFMGRLSPLCGLPVLVLILSPITDFLNQWKGQMKHRNDFALSLVTDNCPS